MLHGALDPTRLSFGLLASANGDVHLPSTRSLVLSCLPALVLPPHCPADAAVACTHTAAPCHARPWDWQALSLPRKRGTALVVRSSRAMLVSSSLGLGGWFSVLVVSLGRSQALLLLFCVSSSSRSFLARRGGRACMPMRRLGSVSGGALRRLTHARSSAHRPSYKLRGTLLRMCGCALLVGATTSAFPDLCNRPASGNSVWPSRPPLLLPPFPPCPVLCLHRSLQR